MVLDTDARSASDDRHRDAALAAALARLEVCARRRDTTAAVRVLDRLPASDDGAWLLLQMAAAGLRALGAGAQQLPPDAVRRRSLHTRDEAITAGAQITATVVPDRWRSP